LTEIRYGTENQVYLDGDIKVDGFVFVAHVHSHAAGVERNFSAFDLFQYYDRQIIGYLVYHDEGNGVGMLFKFNTPARSVEICTGLEEHSNQLRGLYRLYGLATQGSTNFNERLENEIKSIRDNNTNHTHTQVDDAANCMPTNLEKVLMYLETKLQQIDKDTNVRKFLNKELELLGKAVGEFFDDLVPLSFRYPKIPDIVNVRIPRHTIKTRRRK
jgi:hypothetical protein